MQRGSESASEAAWNGGGAAPAKRLDQLLVERKDVAQADIDKALQIQRSVGGRLGALLVRTGAISEDLLLQRLAEQQGAVVSAKPRGPARHPGGVPVPLRVSDQD